MPSLVRDRIDLGIVLGTVEPDDRNADEGKEKAGEEDNASPEPDLGSRIGMERDSNEM